MYETAMRHLICRMYLAVVIESFYMNANDTRILWQNKSAIDSEERSDFASIIANTEEWQSDLCEDCMVVVDIAQSVPLNYALPLYGFVMPLLVAITTLTNIFIVIVLSQKHLRTPTNFVLVSMAIVDLLTGLTSVPWFIYYYTLRGFESDERFGLSKFWCHVYPYLSYIVPTVWHTAGIWLTVFLAVQRYVYVCVPTLVPTLCTPYRTRLIVLLISLLSFVTEMPDIFGKFMEQIQVDDRNICLLRHSSWVYEIVGVQLFYSFIYWFRVAFVQIIPCLLLIIFTFKLTRIIKRSEMRKRSLTSGISPDQSSANHNFNCERHDRWRNNLDGIKSARNSSDFNQHEKTQKHLYQPNLPTSCQQRFSLTPFFSTPKYRSPSLQNPTHLLQHLQIATQKLPSTTGNAEKSVEICLSENGSSSMGLIESAKPQKDALNESNNQPLQNTKRDCDKMHQSTSNINSDNSICNTINSSEGKLKNTSTNHDNNSIKKITYDRSTINLVYKGSYGRACSYGGLPSLCYSTTSSSSASSGRSLNATNRMLAAICFVFLLLEVPAALIFTLHFLIAARYLPNAPGAYRILNVALIIRNILIVLTSPLQFFIYCSMSEQFRLTVRQLFSSRLLFIAQAQATFHGGKRYSLILVDVDLIQQQQNQQQQKQKQLKEDQLHSFQQQQTQQQQQTRLRLSKTQNSRLYNNNCKIFSQSGHSNNNNKYKSFGKIRNINHSNSNNNSNINSSSRDKPLRKLLHIYIRRDLPRKGRSASTAESTSLGPAHQKEIAENSSVRRGSSFRKSVQLDQANRAIQEKVNSSNASITPSLFTAEGSAIEVELKPVAICVMSFAVYFEWNSFVWNLGPTLCNLYIGADVACSTASILNLLAISLDRFMAIKYPLTYTQYGANSNRALFSIFVVWSISLGVGLPVFFGANNIDQNKEEFCEFTNPYFIIISSILSFFVPCALMIVLYAVIFQQLRARERARTLRHLRRTKRDAGFDMSTNERIGNALISGARWHCQMGTHFKTRGDQMLLELSLQTSSFPTLTPSASTESMISRWCGGFETHSSLNIHAADSTLNVNNSSEMPQQNIQIPEHNDQQHQQQQEQQISAQVQHELLCLRRCNTVPLPTNNNCLDGMEKSNRKSLAVALLQKSQLNVHKNSLNICNASNSSLGQALPKHSLPTFQMSESIGTTSQLEKYNAYQNRILWETQNGDITEKIGADEVANEFCGENNSAFGGHFDDLFPFIDSMSPSSSYGERLANHCYSNKYFRQSSRTNSMVTKNRLTVSQLTPPISQDHLDENCANGDINQTPSATVFDAVIIGQEFSSEIHLPLRLTASNGHLSNNSNRNYLSLSFVNTALNSSLAQKSAKFSNGNACDSIKFNNNNSNNNNVNNCSNHIKFYRPKNLKSATDSFNSKRGCCKFTYSCERLFEWFRVSSNSSNVSSSLPSGICVNGHSTMVRDHSPMMLNNNNCRKLIVDKNNNEDFSYVRRKPKGGNSFGRCLTFVGEFCLELWQKVYIGRGSYQKRFGQTTRPSRQLVKKATKQMKREQKATVTLAVVLAVFLVCWVPFFTLHLTNAICILSERDNCVYFLATFLSTWLGYLNSSLNPLIYTVFDQRFRKAFRNILNCRH